MEKQLATLTGFVGAVISYAVDCMGLAVVILIVMMSIDYASGVLVAMSQRTLNSRIGFNGIVRKIYYLLLVGAMYTIALVIPNIGYAGDGVAIGLAVLELVSITENGTKLGLPMPKAVKDLLLIVKNESEKSGEKK